MYVPGRLVKWAFLSYPSSSVTWHLLPCLPVPLEHGARHWNIHCPCEGGRSQSACSSDSPLHPSGHTENSHHPSEPSHVLSTRPCPNPAQRAILCFPHFFVLSYLLTPPLLTQPGFANPVLPDQFLLEYGLEVMGNHGQFCRAHQSEPSRGWLSAMMLKWSVCLKCSYNNGGSATTTQSDTNSSSNPRKHQRIEARARRMCTILHQGQRPCCLTAHRVWGNPNMSACAINGDVESIAIP